MIASRATSCSTRSYSQAEARIEMVFDQKLSKQRSSGCVIIFGLDVRSIGMVFMHVLVMKYEVLHDDSLGAYRNSSSGD